jgi:hypothetical protein
VPALPLLFEDPVTLTVLIVPTGVLAGFHVRCSLAASLHKHGPVIELHELDLLERTVELEHSAAMQRVLRCSDHAARDEATRQHDNTR